MTDSTKAATRCKQELDNLRQQYFASIKDFNVNREANACRATQIRKLGSAHEAAIRLINSMESAIVESDILSSNSAWARDLANTAVEVLQSVIIHHEILKRESARLDVPCPKPSANAYSKMQRAVVRFNPDQAARFKEEFATHGLPTKDFANISAEHSRLIAQSMTKCKVLLLSASPQGLTRLALDEECREITQKIRASEHRDSLHLVTCWAVRPDDLLQYLNEIRPHVVHFSGHGNTAAEIILLNNNGDPSPVTASALTKLFSTLKDNIRLVVLNACYSKTQAKAIKSVIDCTIGMKRDIGDRAAITFAASFYRAIGFGRSVQEAFDQGKAALLLEGIPEESTPELLVRKGVDPKAVFLVTTSSIPTEN